MKTEQKYKLIELQKDEEGERLREEIRKLKE